MRVRRPLLVAIASVSLCAGIAGPQTVHAYTVCGTIHRDSSPSGHDSANDGGDANDQVYGYAWRDQGGNFCGIQAYSGASVSSKAPGYTLWSGTEGNGHNSVYIAPGHSAWLWSPVERTTSGGTVFAEMLGRNGFASDVYVAS